MTCVSHASTSPQSLLIQLTQPSGASSFLGKGDLIGASFEWKAVKPAKADLGAKVHVPTTWAEFHLSNGANLKIMFVHRNLTVINGQWSAPIFGSLAVGSAVSFTTTPARLTSQWLAVMSNTPYGHFAVEFRWHWSLANSTGAVFSVGPWSGANLSSSTSQQPTKFYPAPWLGEVSNNGPSRPSGSNYTIDVRGNVSSTMLRLLIENGGGKELNSVCLYTPRGATSFNASLPLNFLNGTSLPPGSDIIHIHNAGGAIVLFEKVKVL